MTKNSDHLYIGGTIAARDGWHIVTGNSIDLTNVNTLYIKSTAASVWWNDDYMYCMFGVRSTSDSSFLAGVKLTKNPNAENLQTINVSSIIGKHQLQFLVWNNSGNTPNAWAKVFEIYGG